MVALALAGWTWAGLGVAGAMAAGPGEGMGSPGGSEGTRGEVALRVFRKGDQVRLYSTGAAEVFMGRAKWKRGRASTPGLEAQWAELDRDDTPPPLPGPGRGWQEARVVPFSDWRIWARSAVTGLVPERSGRGVYVQTAVGDAVVFRDEAGLVRAAPFGEGSAGLEVERRLGAAEAGALVGQAVEEKLREAHPGEAFFVLESPPVGRVRRWGLVDVMEGRVLVLLERAAGGGLGSGGGMGSKAAGLASFVLVDHVWAFIKNPVSSLGRTLHQGIQWTGLIFDPRLRLGNGPVVPVLERAGMDLEAWERWLDRHTGTRRERGKVRLLLNGEVFFPVFERRIQEAERGIDVRVCIFDRDDVGVQVADWLKARSTNVAVRVVYDRLNTKAAGRAPPGTPMEEGFEAPRNIGAYLREGSRVGVRPMLNPGFSADHTKVFLIDGKYAYVGGMNLGREYRYEWHDLMVEVEGPVVASFQKDFEKKWAQSGVWGDCGWAVAALGGGAEGTAAGGAEGIALRRLSTKTFDRQIRRAELAAVGRAQRYVYVENTYLYDNEMLTALAKARGRGVDVRVVMPRRNDVEAGQRSNLVAANYLVSHGVRVFLYPGMTHVKSMVADGWVCFGSANFDALSLRLNREADLASSDPGLAASLGRELFAVDFAKSSEMLEPVAVGWVDHLAESVLDFF